MADHNYVVRRIKAHHERRGDDITADLPTYQKPPKAHGPRGRGYIPDVHVFNRRLAYEVKEYNAARNATSKLKALQASPRIRELNLVLCTGTPRGVARIRNFLRREGVNCNVINYRNLPFW